MKWFFLLLLFPLTAFSQDISFLACARVAFFEPACPVESPPVLPAPPPVPMPLFTPETMARDTPPLLTTLLETPTVENARTFLAWQQHRLARIAEVQQLLKTLTQSLPRKEP
jgi:hypothetical protein